jgi:hypothetical protein
VRDGQWGHKIQPDLQQGGEPSLKNCSVSVSIASLPITKWLSARTHLGVGKVIDGPIELCFSEWELDEFDDRAIIPYHVRLCIEGIPQHAWS